MRCDLSWAMGETEDWDRDWLFSDAGSEGTVDSTPWWEDLDPDEDFLDYEPPPGASDQGPPPRPFTWRATSFRKAECWARTYDGVATLSYLLGPDVIELLFRERKRAYERGDAVDDVPFTSTMKLAVRARRPPPAGHAAQHRCLPHRARAAGPPSEAGTTRDPLEGVPTEALINELLKRRSVISAPLGSADAPPRRRRRPSWISICQSSSPRSMQRSRPVGGFFMMARWLLAEHPYLSGRRYRRPCTARGSRGTSRGWPASDPPAGDRSALPSLL